MIIDEMKDAQFGFKLGFSRHYFLLYSVVLGLEASQVFEFGIGMSTRVLLDALRYTGGNLVSCANMNPLVARMTEDDVRADHWTFLYGKSQDVLSNDVLDKAGMDALDLVLHDGSHTPNVVRSDLKLIVPRMKKNGIILVHDTEHKYTGLLNSVHLALKDIGVKCQCMTLPYGCGLTIVRIVGDQGNGKVKLTWEKQKKQKQVN